MILENLLSTNKTPPGPSGPFEIPQITVMTSSNPSKPLEVPKETELSGAIRILRNKEFEAVQCVSRGSKRF